MVTTRGGSYRTVQRQPGRTLPSCRDLAERWPSRPLPNASRPSSWMHGGQLRQVVATPPPRGRISSRHLRVTGRCGGVRENGAFTACAMSFDDELHGISAATVR